MEKSVLFDTEQSLPRIGVSRRVGVCITFWFVLVVAEAQVRPPLNSNEIGELD
jgi:hypothetical protein